MKIGIVGCGNISSTYLRLACQFRGMSFTACADQNEVVAKSQAERFGIVALSVEQLLADPDIELILNLTVPSAHAEVSTRILEAGKHVYSEKPFVLSVSEGQALKKLADAKGLRIGSAPDTFFGGAHQRSRALIDSGEIGAINGGTACFMNNGMEHWHPNPDFFFQLGGGPMLDMGPYYLSNLVQLIGPVKRVAALSCTPRQTRQIESEPRAGEVINVETPTSITALLEFHSGTQMTLMTSWDVRAHEHNCMELYGSEGTLIVPDPNFFGGDIRICVGKDERVADADHPMDVANDPQEDGVTLVNYRGAGMADMIAAIGEGRPHRCNGQLALHVVDIMTSCITSGESGEFVTLGTSCVRPDAVDAASARGLLA